MLGQRRLVALEELRARLEELRERVRTRLGAGVSGQQIGQGALIERARSRLEELTARVKERKPVIVPKVVEALEQWKPGSRISEIVPKLEKRVAGTSSSEYPLRE
jgi:hypothetical protein